MRPRLFGPRKISGGGASMMAFARFNEAAAVWAAEGRNGAGSCHHEGRRFNEAAAVWAAEEGSAYPLCGAGPCFNEAAAVWAAEAV